MNGALLDGTGLVVKLGRRLPLVRRPALRFAALLPQTVPPPPDELDLRPGGVQWPQYANDRYGDCVFACIGHMLGLWTDAATHHEALFTDADVLGWYAAVTGFNPSRPWTDQGAVIQDALDYWIRTGASGHRLAGYVSVHPNDSNTVKLATEVFGGLDLGINMPAAWQSQTGPGKAWDVGPSQGGQWSPGSWGGHSVPVVAYDRSGLTVVTWGAEQRMTWAALERYADEAWGCASWEWCVSGQTPAGIPKDVFVEAFGVLGGGPLGPDPTPPPPPGPTPPGPTPPGPTPPPPPAGVIMLDIAERYAILPSGWSVHPPEPTDRKGGS